MAINVSVQYNGGLLPDIILLIRWGYVGELFRYHKEFLPIQPVFPPKFVDNFPPEGECSEALDTFGFFLYIICRSTTCAEETNSAVCVLHRPYQSVRLR